ncbi:hypothetical protein GCM10010191_04730 [Actinomadura vinacea]|uniref:Uncharacterized protein n=1 Tax=Actinomadura vinacea TaxID=115336 RepID=A0ABN3IDE1_9ACTN
MGNTDNVSAGSKGFAYFGAAGTAALADITSNWPSGWGDAGIIKEEGLTEALAREEVTHMGWDHGAALPPVFAGGGCGDPAGPQGDRLAWGVARAGRAGGVEDLLSDVEELLGRSRRGARLQGGSGPSWRWTSRRAGISTSRGCTGGGGW